MIFGCGPENDPIVASSIVKMMINRTDPYSRSLGHLISEQTQLSNIGYGSWRGDPYVWNGWITCIVVRIGTDGTDVGPGALSMPWVLRLTPIWYGWKLGYQQSHPFYHLRGKHHPFLRSKDSAPHGPKTRMNTLPYDAVRVWTFNEW